MPFADHFKFIVGMKANQALNAAEGDPGQVFDYNYDKQLEQLQELRRSIGDVVTNEKQIELMEAQQEAQQARYQQQAEDAMKAGREDLAKIALQRKAGLDSQVAQYKQQHDQLEAQHQKLVLLDQQMSQRIEQFRSQKEMVKAQYRASAAEVKVTEIATGLTDASTQMNLAMQHAQDKVLAMQAHASAIDTLLQEGALNTGMPGVGGQDDIDKQLAAISSQHNVDDELAALRQKVGGPAQPGLISGPSGS